MHSLYLTTSPMSNHHFKSRTKLLTIGHTIWQELIIPFITLLIPALLGSLLVMQWLTSLTTETPFDPDSIATERLQSLQQIKPARILPRIMASKNELLPTLEALEGLFAPPFTHAQPTIQNEPNTLSDENSPIAGMSPLEVQINQALLEDLDPYILTHEEKRIFINNIPTGYPLHFTGITSPFGYRVHPTLHKTRFHPGVDLNAPMNTQITATADGVIEFTSDSDNRPGMSGFGNMITVLHNFGFRTTYSHLNKILVQPGDFVRKGEIIGLSGNSGIATAPHLHYEIHFIQHRLNPNNFMQWTQTNNNQLFRDKHVQWRSLLELISTRLSKQTTQTSVSVAMRQNNSSQTAQ